MSLIFQKKIKLFIKKMIIRKMLKFQKEKL
jgi:hypothetical protein